MFLRYLRMVKEVKVECSLSKSHISLKSMKNSTILAKSHCYFYKKTKKNNNIYSYQYYNDKINIFGFFLEAVLRRAAAILKDVFFFFPKINIFILANFFQFLGYYVCSQNLLH